MLDQVINLRMLGHPVNWLIVWTVLLFTAFAWTLVHNRANALPVTTTTPAQ
jgi:hypothetical protein